MHNSTYSIIKEKKTTAKKGDNVSKILISCDINCSRITERMYNTMLSELAHNNADTHIHIYNYLPKKHTFITGEYNEITHAYNGSHKRVALDLTQALDTIKLALQDNFDMIYLITGEYESETLYSKLSEINVHCTKVTVTASSVIKECIHNCTHSDGIGQNNAIPSPIINDMTPPYQVNDSIIEQLDTCDNSDIDNVDNNTYLSIDDSDNNTQDISQNSIINSNITYTKQSKHMDISLLNTLPPETLRVLVKYILDKKSKCTAV